MIKEIVQFVDLLPESTFSKNIQLKDGLYIFLDLEEEDRRPVLKNLDRNGKIREGDFGVWTSKMESSPFFEKCLQIQLNTLPVSPQKIFNPDKKIFNSSCSPFALCFTKKNFSKYEQNRELVKQQLKDQYFKAAEKYVTEDRHRPWFESFKTFLVENLPDFLVSLPEYKEAKDSFTINIYCKKVELSDFVSTHGAYLKENVFNKAQYNVEHEGTLLGISDSLSGFNEKKRFLQHKTGFTDLNYRITGAAAQSLWQFFKLQQNRQLPNPTPIFVDKQELNLNRDLVSFYQDEKILSYSSLVQKLVEQHKTQLHNFYLIFFQNGVKGSRIVDLDFVPVFHFELRQSINLVEVFNIGGEFSRLRIQNVFAFLKEILNSVFNYQLIQDTKGGARPRFFEELEANPRYHLTDTMVGLLYKYRKAIYDYIYKSRHQSITCSMFDDMMITSIMDDIRRDDNRSREYAIKEKLNIWFNFWDYFANNQNRINMANRTVEILDRLKQVVENEHEHVRDDEEFAFAAGQLIWKILVQSKSASRTHALLEPFLQKVDALELKLAIARSFDTYSHAFVMYPKKYGFEKLMSEVMGYAPEETNMKRLVHIILAGYFAESLFRKGNGKDDDQEQ